MAIEILGAFLEVQTKALGEDDLAVAATLHQIGTLLRGEGK